MKKLNTEMDINMRMQKPYGTKQIINLNTNNNYDISHKKIHRRINTQIDQHHKYYKPLENKKTMRTSSKPKFLDVYSKYTATNTVKDSITQRKNFKVIPSNKPTYAVKQMRTEPDQIFIKKQQKKQPSKKKNIPTITNSKIMAEQKYQFQGVAGKGTFGVVYFGINKQTGEKIAVKKVFQDKKYKNRQHLILQMLNHPNVLQMKDSFLTFQGQEQYLNIIMDFYSDNLYQVIKKKQINMTNYKLYTYQIFRALNYLNMLSIAHRDMKPQNILVDLNKNKSIICDFGSAKKLVKSEANLAYICSRCYRAPELIFGATNYNTQIDMWSMGCILVEMVNGHPPFLADSQIDQLIQIIKVLGTPSQIQVEQMNPDYDMKEYNKFPKIKPTAWKNLLKTKDPLLIDLITKTLQYSPMKRITPSQALLHEFFDDLRDQSKFYQMKQKLKVIPQLFNFTQDEENFIYNDCKQKTNKQLIPKWYKQPINKLGLTLNNISISNKSQTLSNMITKPSTNQVSRAGTGLNYMGKKMLTQNYINK